MDTLKSCLKVEIEVVILIESDNDTVLLVCKGNYFYPQVKNKKDLCHEYFRAFSLMLGIMQWENAQFMQSRTANINN